MNPYDLAHQLARALKEGPEYQAFLAARAELDDTARDMLQSYRRREAALRAAYLAGNNPDEAELAEHRRVAELVAAHIKVRACLEADERVARIFQDVQEILGGALADWMSDMMAATLPPS